MHKDMKEILFTQEQITERCKEFKGVYSIPSRTF